MIDKINNLTLSTLDGENIIKIDTAIIDSDINYEENKKSFRLFDKNYNFKYEFKLEKINSFLFYYLIYGIKITNNYLKNHGGIMIRKKAGVKNKNYLKN